MNAYRIIGLGVVAALLIIFLLSSILYRTLYPLIWFFILVIVGWLVAKTLFRKEKQLITKKKEEEISARNVFLKLLLFLLIAYPFLSIPRYLAGTPVKTLLAGYIGFIAGFGTMWILGKVLGLYKPEYRFTFPVHNRIFILKVVFLTLASIGAWFLLFAVVMWV